MDRMEYEFWRWAATVAACTRDKGVSYGALKAQFRGQWPNATDEERKAADTRLQALLRIE